MLWIFINNKIRSIAVLILHKTGQGKTLACQNLKGSSGNTVKDKPVDLDVVRVKT